MGAKAGKIRRKKEAVVPALSGGEMRRRRTLGVNASNVGEV